MANLNRKGPQNEGPMTGRKLGHCNPENKGKTDAEIYAQRESGNQSRCGMQQRKRNHSLQSSNNGFMRKCKRFFGFIRNENDGVNAEYSDNRQRKGYGKGKGRGMGKRFNEAGYNNNI
jgi:hypothetical protein